MKDRNKHSFLLLYVLLVSVKASKQNRTYAVQRQLESHKLIGTTPFHTNHTIPTPSTTTLVPSNQNYNLIKTIELLTGSSHLQTTVLNIKEFKREASSIEDRNDSHGPREDDVNAKRRTAKKTKEEAGEFKMTHKRNVSNKGISFPSNRGSITFPTNTVGRGSSPKDLHTDTNLLRSSFGNNSPLDKYPENRCGQCQCGQNFLTVTCEHKHEFPQDANHTLYLTADLLPLESYWLKIVGYERVEIAPFTFANPNLKLELVEFENVKNLVLAKNSLYVNGTAPENYEMNIEFINCHIERMDSGALTQNEQDREGKQLEETRFLSISFHRCTIDVISHKAISRARVIYFNMTESKIKKMEENAINLLIYEVFRVSKSNLSMVNPSTFKLFANKVVFEENALQHVGNRSLVIKTDGQVLFAYNNVGVMKEGALMAILPQKGSIGASIVFLQNVIELTDEGSLEIDEAFPVHERKVLNNSFGIVCNCNISTAFTKLLGGSFGSPKLDKSFQRMLENSRCRIYDNHKIYRFIDKYIIDECSEISIVTIVALSAALAFFLIAIIVCVIAAVRLNQFQEESNAFSECASQSFSTLSRNYTINSQHYSEPPHSPSWLVAVPEVKTYQQGELPPFSEQTEAIVERRKDSYQSTTIGLVLPRASCPFN